MASPFCFRPGHDLAARIDAAAGARGLRRSEWLAWAVERALGEGAEGGPPAGPDVVAGMKAGDVSKASPSSPAPARASAPADGSARADAFRAAAARRLGR